MITCTDEVLVRSELQEPGPREYWFNNERTESGDDEADEIKLKEANDD